MTPTREQVKEALERAVQILADDSERPSYDWESIATILRAHLSTFDAERDLLDAAMIVGKWLSDELDRTDVMVVHSHLTGAAHLCRAYRAAKEKA